jgi:hypothetical protein
MKTFLDKFLRCVQRRSSWLLLLAACLFPAMVGAAQTPQTPAATTDESHKPAAAQEQKISPREAEELFRSVDEILQFASKDTGLPIKQVVKRQLVGRDQVVGYLQKSMAEDKDAKRLQRSELVLKKFGLLPRDFNLQTFLVALLREQVAGYYDPKTKTVNLLDWLDAEQQKPVLAHELTHALQDQSFNLEKWMKAGDKDLDDVKNPTPEDFESDEIGQARQGIVEGQAMVTLVDYMLAPLGKSMLTSPEMADVLKKGMVEGTADSPEFKNAPIFLKEVLIFPYRYGLDFEAALLQNGGKEKAFAGVFANPPQNTRQVMEPKTYLSGERIEPMQLPDFKKDFKDYDRFDIGAMGEFDVAVLVDQYAGTETSQKIYPQWRGGYYYAVRPKGNAAAPLGLLYLSRWADDASASKFAAIYAKSLTARYKQVHEAPATGQKQVDLQALAALTGTHSWSTEEGNVEIAIQGAQVLITESLDGATVDRVRQELLAAAVGK